MLNTRPEMPTGFFDPSDSPGEGLLTNYFKDTKDAVDFIVTDAEDYSLKNSSQKMPGSAHPEQLELPFSISSLDQDEFALTAGESHGFPESTSLKSMAFPPIKLEKSDDSISHDLRGHKGNSMMTVMIDQPSIHEIMTLPTIVFFETKKNHSLRVYRQNLTSSLDAFFTDLVNKQSYLNVTCHMYQNTEEIVDYLKTASILTFNQEENCYQCSIDILVTSSRNKKVYLNVCIDEVNYTSNVFKIQNHPPRKRKFPQNSLQLFACATPDAFPVEFHLCTQDIDSLHLEALMTLKSVSLAKNARKVEDYDYFYMNLRSNDKWNPLASIDEIENGTKILLTLKPLSSSSSFVGEQEMQPQRTVVRNLKQQPEMDKTMETMLQLYQNPSMSTIALRIYSSNEKKERLTQFVTNFKPYLMKNSSGLLWFSFSAQDYKLACLCCFSTQEEAAYSMKLAKSWIHSQGMNHYEKDLSRSLSLVHADLLKMNSINNVPEITNDPQLSSITTNASMLTNFGALQQQQQQQASIFSSSSADPSKTGRSISSCRSEQEQEQEQELESGQPLMTIEDPFFGASKNFSDDEYIL